MKQHLLSRVASLALCGLAAALVSGCATSAGGDPTKPAESLRGTALMNVAEHTAQSGDDAAAVSLFREAHRRNPHDAKPLLGLGGALFRLGAFEQAAQAYREALKIPGVEAEARRGLGNALVALDRPALAVEQFTTSLGHKKDARTFNGLGVAYDMQGEHEHAQAMYRAGLQMTPGALALRNNLGLSLAASGDYREAISVLKQAVSAPNAGPRERNNLALAYGLAGDTSNAARISRRDMDEAAVKKNLAMYAALRARNLSSLPVSGKTPAPDATAPDPTADAQPKSKGMPHDAAAPMKKKMPGPSAKAAPGPTADAQPMPKALPHDAAPMTKTMPEPAAKATPGPLADAQPMPKPTPHDDAAVMTKTMPEPSAKANAASAAIATPAPAPPAKAAPAMSDATAAELAAAYDYPEVIVPPAPAPAASAKPAEELSATAVAKLAAAYDYPATTLPPEATPSNAPAVPPVTSQAAASADVTAAAKVAAPVAPAVPKTSAPELSAAAVAKLAAAYDYPADSAPAPDMTPAAPAAAIPGPPADTVAPAPAGAEADVAPSEATPEAPPASSPDAARAAAAAALRAAPVAPPHSMRPEIAPLATGVVFRPGTMPEPVMEAALPLHGTYYRARLAAYSSRMDATQGWLDMVKRAPELYGAVQIVPEHSTLNATRVSYALVTPPVAERAPVVKMCAELEGRGIACHVESAGGDAALAPG